MNFQRSTLLSLMFLSLAVNATDIIAQHSEPGEPVAGNHYDDNQATLFQRIKNDVVQLKNLQPRITAKENEVRGYDQKLQALSKQNLSKYEQRILSQAYSQNRSASQAELDRLNQEKSQIQANMASIKKECEANEVKAALYHVNDFADFQKPIDWVQPWVTDSVTRLGWSQGVLRAPVDQKDAGGLLEKARLMKVSDNLFQYQKNTSNHIHQIEVTNKASMFGDQYIKVTFRDGGVICYKQPLADRLRDRSDTWYITFDWWLNSPHQPAAGKSAHDYAQEILLLRPKVAGDKNDQDYTYTGIKNAELFVDDVCFAGQLVLGVGEVGIFVVFLGMMLLAIGFAAEAGAIVWGLVVVTLCVVGMKADVDAFIDTFRR